MAKLTPAQRQYIRKKTKVHDLDPSEAAGELNIIPFLDIVMNLIMFLLMTTSTAIALAQINSQLPEYSRGIGGRSSNEEPTLNLTVLVVEQGAIVTGSGAKLAPGCRDVNNSTAAGDVITVPRINGEYDWAGLTECASRIKEQFPEENEVKVTADPLIEYRHLIAALDALRNKDTEALFPDVLIAAGVR
ncbi:MAG: biopolymer transporter ExbD [Deltaproteobacteria bacterium]|nr:biopolymer transporter ExbD [Deltaproteobacteria bacterium]